MDLSRLLAAVRFGLVVWVALAPAATVHAFCRLTTEMPIDGGCTKKGIPLWWKRECITFSVRERDYDDPSLRKIRDAASASFAVWTEARCNNEAPVALKVAQTALLGECDDPEYNRQSGNANTVIFIVDWADRELPADAFGLTLVWHDTETGQIFDADMQINETLGDVAICDGECPQNAVDLQNVMAHEAGHFLGLGHSPEPTATMSARATIGETIKRDLHIDDRAGICTIYGEGEPKCSIADYMPDNAFSQICSPPELRQACGVSAPRGDGRLGIGGLMAFAALAASGWRRSRRSIRCARRSALR
jgi:hypothetical protein